jgi:hypothetical protein
MIRAVTTFDGTVCNEMCVNRLTDRSGGDQSLCIYIYEPYDAFF